MKPFAIALVVFLSQSAHADGTYAVGANTPVAKGRVRDILCAAALKKAAEYDIQGMPARPLVVTEVFAEKPSGRTEFHENLARTLIRSRVLNEESYYYDLDFSLGAQADEKNEEGQGEHSVEDAYDNLIQVDAVYPIGDWAIPVSVAKAELEDGFLSSGAAIIPTAVWGIQTGAPYKISGSLFTASIGAPTTHLVVDPENEIPGDVFYRLQRFDFFKEFSGQPHSVDGYTTYENNSRPPMGVLEPRYYEIVNPETREVEGYIVEVVKQETRVTDNAEAMYRSHMRASYVQEESGEGQRMRIRFDAQGNRVSLKGDYQ